MDAPTQVLVTPNDLTSSIELTWTPAAFNGGLPVLGYYLQINSGYGTPFTSSQVQVAASTDSYTYENLIAGATYQFRISAYNRLEADNKQFDDVLNYSDASEYTIANEPG